MVANRGYARYAKTEAFLKAKNLGKLDIDEARGAVYEAKAREQQGLYGSMEDALREAERDFMTGGTKNRRDEGITCYTNTDEWWAEYEAEQWSEAEHIATLVKPAKRQQEADPRMKALAESINEARQRKLAMLRGQVYGHANRLLDEFDRRIFYRYAEGFTQADIAYVLEVSRKTVNERWGAIRAKLYRAMLPKWRRFKENGGQPETRTTLGRPTNTLLDYLGYECEKCGTHSPIEGACVFCRARNVHLIPPLDEVTMKLDAKARKDSSLHKWMMQTLFLPHALDSTKNVDPLSEWRTVGKQREISKASSEG